MMTSWSDWQGGMLENCYEQNENIGTILVLISKLCVSM